MHLPDWLWQGIITSVLATGACIVLAVLRKRLSPWASPLLYGLGGLACVIVCSASFYVSHSVSKLTGVQADSLIDIDHIDQSVRNWMDSAGLTVTRWVPKTSVWAYQVIMPSKRHFMVSQGNRESKYILIDGNDVFAGEVGSALSHLDRRGHDIVVYGLTLELGRFDIGSDIDADTLRTVLQSRVPISISTTREQFISRLEAIDRASGNAEEFVAMQILMLNPNIH